MKASTLRNLEKEYENLSPFELKNKLISMAQSHHERLMLNAGRGNPNWVAITPRQAFFQFGLFAIEESLRVMDLPAIGGPCEKKGIATRFGRFLKQNSEVPGMDFLGKAYKTSRRRWTWTATRSFRRWRTPYWATIIRCPTGCFP